MTTGEEPGREPARLVELFEQLYEPLVRSLRAGGFVDAEDAVQEAFVQAQLHWRRVRRYDDPAAWVRRAAVNRCLNARRSRRRQQAVADRLGSQLDGVRTGSEVGVDVSGAIARLAPQQRIAVALFYLGDMSVVQVADAMSLTEGAVKYHLHAAREALRASLGVQR